LYERLIWLKDNSFCSVGTICGWDKNDQDRRSCGTFYAFPSYDAPGVPMDASGIFFAVLPTSCAYGTMQEAAD